MSNAIQDLLDLAAGASLAHQIQGGIMPDEPDECTVINAYGGETPRDYGPNNEPHEEPYRFQVVTRAMYQRRAMDLADAALAALSFRHEVINGTRYAFSRPLQRPVFLAQDKRDRQLVVFNLQVRRYANLP